MDRGKDSSKKKKENEGSISVVRRKGRRKLLGQFGKNKSGQEREKQEGQVQGTTLTDFNVYEHRPRTNKERDYVASLKALVKGQVPWLTPMPINPSATAMLKLGLCVGQKAFHGLIRPHGPSKRKDRITDCPLVHHCHLYAQWITYSQKGSNSHNSNEERLLCFDKDKPSPASTSTTSVTLIASSFTSYASVFFRIVDPCWICPLLCFILIAISSITPPPVPYNSTANAPCLFVCLSVCGRESVCLNQQ